MAAATHFLWVWAPFVGHTFCTWVGSIKPL